MPLTGKTILISGATDGIGKQAAHALAAQGARVLILGRNPEKTNATAEEIRQQTGNPEIATYLADLSLIASTQAVAEQILANEPRLDVLLNNAGAMFMSRQTTADGFEATFALNHLVGYFMLTRCLLPRIHATAQSSGEARIISVASDAHLNNTLNFDDLQLTKGFMGFSAYGKSKLANVMFGYALARRLHGTGITSNVVHPGFVRTQFGQTNNRNNLIMRLVMPIATLFAKKVEDGASTSIYLASSPNVAGQNGKYWVSSRSRKSSDVSYDEAAQERLWEVSEALLAEKGVSLPGLPA